MDATPIPRRSPALPIALGIGLALTAAAQAVTVIRYDPPSPVLLRLNVEEGLTVSYRVEMEMEGRVSAGLAGQPLEFVMALEQDWEVQEVGEDGSATIEIDTRLIEASSPQGDLPRSEVEAIEAPSTMRLAPDGRILDVSFGATGGITGPTNIPGLESLAPSFPQDPVTPGDRWDLSADVPFLPGGPSLQLAGQALLEGYEETQGIRSALIVSDVRLPFDLEVDAAALVEELGGEPLPEGELGGTIVYEGEMTMSSRQWVDPETGLQVRSEAAGGGEIAFSIGGLSQNGDTPSVPRTTMEFELTMTLERR